MSSSAGGGISVLPTKEGFEMATPRVCLVCGPGEGKQGPGYRLTLKKLPRYWGFAIGVELPIRRIPYTSRYVLAVCFRGIQLHKYERYSFGSWGTRLFMIGG